MIVTRCHENRYASRGQKEENRQAEFPVIADLLIRCFVSRVYLLNCCNQQQSQTELEIETAMASDHYCFDVQGVVGDGVCDGTEILVRYIR